MDSTKYILNSDSISLTQGTYSYTGNLVYNVGDIIVGQTGVGYLRKITRITHIGIFTIFNTSQAYMTDVFKTANIAIATPTPGLSYAGDKIISKSNSRLKTNDITATRTLLDKPYITVVGSVDFEPNLMHHINYSNGALHHLDFGFQNAQLTGKLDIMLKGSVGTDLSDEMPIVSKRVIGVKFIGPVPVVYVTTYSITAKYSIKLAGNMSKEISVINNSTANSSISYDDGIWSATAPTLSSATTVTASDFKTNVKLQVTFSLIPKVSVDFYGVAGPYALAGLNTSLTGTLALPSLDWDFDAEGWANLQVGAQIGVLGYQRSYVGLNKESDHISYKTPVAMAKFSGDMQRGDPGKKLAEPIQAIVTDSKGTPQPYVPVYFIVTVGGGKVENGKVITDMNGIAKTTWTLGNSLDSQKVEAKAMRGDETIITSAPLSFVANNNLYIGEKAFGGVICYLDHTKKHGLAMDTVDLAKNVKSDTDPSSYAVEIYGTDGINHILYFTGIDTTAEKGNFNTALLLRDRIDNKAMASYCVNYRGGGYNDWFLPSYIDLLRIYRVKTQIGMIQSANYWSSSAVNGPPQNDFGEYALLAINFGTGNYIHVFYDDTDINSHNSYNANLIGNVRAVRVF